MKFFAVLIALALTIPSFAQNDSIALLEKKLDQMQYQFYFLQSKVNIIDQDLNSFKNLSSDSIKLLMQKNEALAVRVENSETRVDKQKMDIDMLEKTQDIQGGLLENFLWLVALGFLIIAALFIFSFIHQRKKLNSQRELLERLFMDNLRTLESELKEITTANRDKTLKLESEFHSFANETKEHNEKLTTKIDKVKSKASKEHLTLEKAIKNSEKELAKRLGTLKAKITKTEKKFTAADKTLASSIEKNKKGLKDKIDKLKANTKKDHEALMNKLKDELQKSNKKVKALKKDFRKTQKRKAVTFRVKKSS